MLFILSIILILLDVFLFVKIFNYFFEEEGDFKDSLWYFFKSDIVSIFQGDFWEDFESEMRLKAFIVVCLLILFVEFYLLILAGLNIEQFI